MAKNDGMETVYSKTTGRKHRIPKHWVDHPVLGARFEKTPRQRDAEAKSAGGSRADHPDQPTPEETAAAPVPAESSTPETAPSVETDKSEPVVKKKASSTTETPANRGEE